jgi:serine phosphatase RsbU (regulator of sigma subunit)
VATQALFMGDQAPEDDSGIPFELAGLAALTVDLDGAVLWSSRAAAGMFGRTADELAGVDVRDLLCATDRVAVKEALAEASAGRPWSGLLGVCPDTAAHTRFAFHWELTRQPGSPPCVLVLAAPLAPTGLTVLTEAGARIGTSLDLGKTALEVAEVAVPRFAAAASVFALERLLVADELTHREPAGCVVVRRLATHVADHSAGSWNQTVPVGEVIVFPQDSPYARCMETRAPVQFDHVGDDVLERVRRRDGGAELVGKYRSFLAAPLATRDAVVGLAVFARAGRDDAFGSQDVAVASELAARAAVCIENARLFTREQRTALVLQRSLAPRRAIAPEGVDVAHRSLPAGAGIVGGDWLDVVSLPRGRVGLMVGDVMGHGTEAAAVMAQLRTAAHTLADLDLTPDQVLCRLDRIAQHLDDTPFGTCVYAVLDPAARTCSIARAGHLPPVLALPDGATMLLDVPAGLPLGLGLDHNVYQTTEIDLPPGAVLALYTDGLVESRKRPHEVGIATLRDSLSAPSAELGKTCDAAVEALRQGGEDDITLILARVQDG